MLNLYIASKMLSCQSIQNKAYIQSIVYRETKETCHEVRHRIHFCFSLVLGQVIFFLSIVLLITYIESLTVQILYIYKSYMVVFQWWAMENRGECSKRKAINIWLRTIYDEKNIATIRCTRNWVTKRYVTRDLI